MSSMTRSCKKMKPWLAVVSSLFVARESFAEPEPLAPLPTAPATPSPAASPAPSQTPASSTVKMTLEATSSTPPNADRAAGAEGKKSVDDSVLLHGFRLGYGYVMNYDARVPAFEGKSLKEQTGMRAPSHFLLGYEILYRVVSHSWLNVLLLANGMVAGIEQSKFLPSANLLIGAEIKNSFQIGVGANLSPLKGSEAHFIAAAGWTPRVGSIYTPFHVFFIPDVDGVHRMGATTGVTF